jgi:fatty-acyl-CoA synthase/long-chain acyl-CoA synthetase
MDAIAKHAAEQADRPALISADRTITWRELCDRRNRLAHSLLRLGLAPGDHVVLYGHNSLDLLIASAGSRAAGAVPVPMNHRLTAEEVSYILEDSDAAAVFVDDAFVPVVEAVRGTASKVRQWILIGAERRSWARHLDELMAAGPAEPVTIPDGEAFGASMIYTAGTTGRPKGARRRGTDPASLAPRLQALDLTDPNHVHLVAGPLYHSAPSGFALYAHLVGSAVVVMPRFDAEDALRAIERHRCTSTFMAPTLLKRIVDLPPAVRARYDVSSMRVIVVAAAPCPMSVKEAVIAMFGPVLYEFYGSTELGINTVLRPEDVLRKPGSCGRAAPGVEIAILDDGGRPLPAGRPGELYVRRNAAVFDEYYKNPEATRQTQRGEWLSVGDVAYLDEDGFVYICDRKRDMIISGGVNIYPAEVEDTLHRHPAILDAAVFGVPDDEWGERVHAAIEVRAGETLVADEVIAFCRRHLAGYKVPREVTLHERLPRDSAGKLVKRVLREPYWADRTSRV